MTKTDAIIVVSRAIALYFFWWALDALSYLPERLMEAHYSVGRYYHPLDMLAVEFTIFRGVALLAAAFLFYECGPRVEAFLLPGQTGRNTEEVK